MNDDTPTDFDEAETVAQLGPSESDEVLSRKLHELMVELAVPADLDEWRYRDRQAA